MFCSDLLDHHGPSFSHEFFVLRFRYNFLVSFLDFLEGYRFRFLFSYFFSWLNSEFHILFMGTQVRLYLPTNLFTSSFPCRTDVFLRFIRCICEVGGPPRRIEGRLIHTRHVLLKEGLSCRTFLPFSQ